MRMRLSWLLMALAIAALVGIVLSAVPLHFTTHA